MSDAQALLESRVVDNDHHQAQNSSDNKQQESAGETKEGQSSELIWIILQLTQKLVHLFASNNNKLNLHIDTVDSSPTTESDISEVKAAKSDDAGKVEDEEEEDCPKQENKVRLQNLHYYYAHNFIIHIN